MTTAAWRRHWQVIPSEKHAPAGRRACSALESKAAWSWSGNYRSTYAMKPDTSHASSLALLTTLLTPTQIKKLSLRLNDLIKVGYGELTITVVKGHTSRIVTKISEDYCDEHEIK